MLPNQATAVETSRTSHIVTSPISSHYHHHLPPPPPLCAAATAAVGPPSECPLLGQSGGGRRYRRHPQPPRHPHNPPPRHDDDDCPISTATAATSPLCSMPTPHSMPTTTILTATSPDAHHHPPFCVTAHLPAAMSSPANNDDNEPNPQCHVTANCASEEATKGGWEGDTG